jgi:3',5'-cyclic AMP phosphodiesterase CpdA
MATMMQPTRRELLKVGVAGLVVAPTLSLAQLPGKPRGRNRIAFLTDTHLREPGKDEGSSNTRVLKAFAAARAAKPDLTIFGGDNVFAVDYGNAAESAVAQFENWREKVKAHVPGAHLSCIGNHDIWKGDAAKAHAKGGKAYALDVFGMPSRYFRRDLGKWRFLVLDTFHDDGCYLDDEQLNWMEREMASATGPVALVSHAPIVNVGQILEEKKRGRVEAYSMPAGWIIGNAGDVVRMLGRSGKVKLALSGHMHQVERIDLVGTSFVCGGAVSGAWWDGAYLEFFPPNLMVFDLADDGTFSMHNVNYEK